MNINIKDTWARQSPYDRFFDFIAPDAERYSILTGHIEKLKLNSAAVKIEGNSHIFIFPAGQKTHKSAHCFSCASSFNFDGKSPYILCAHYDRVEGSPGANDNSIAVFHLLNAALILTAKGIDNWMIIFTDKEELSAGENPEKQGSYSLAKKIKTWGLENEKIFIFDSCGTGDVLIISTTTDHILKDSRNENINKVRNTILKLRDHALAAANRLRLEKVLLAPTPFSDDAGFLRAGLASLVITALPAQEAEKYESLLRREPDFAHTIISQKIKTPEEKRSLPGTWQNLNSARDTPSRLTPLFFEQVVRFMTELCS